MSLKLYTDTHIAKQVTLQLRAKGVDIVRSEEVDLATASDIEHLRFATREGRAMVSIDRDFRRLHNQILQENLEHSGIFSVSRHLQGRHNIGRIVTELFEYWQLIEAGAGSVEDDIENKIIFIS